MVARGSFAYRKCNTHVIAAVRIDSFMNVLRWTEVTGEKDKHRATY